MQSKNVGPLWNLPNSWWYNNLISYPQLNGKAKDMNSPTKHLPHHLHYLTPNDLPTHNSPTSQKSILNLLNTNSTTSLQHLRQTHALILKSNQFQDHYIAGALVKSYSNPHFSTFTTSIQVFNQVPNPNVFVWNSLIKGCLDNDEPGLVLCFYFKMVVADCRPNKYTFPTLFKACSDLNAVEEGGQIHGHVVKHGFIRDVYVKSAGIQMYASFGCLSDARKLLDLEGDFSDVVCYNAMIDGYLRCGDVEAAKGLFECMEIKNVGSWNSMISGLAKHGMIEAARELFDEMPQRDEISWSAMVDGYNRGGYFKEALEVFNRMQVEKVRPRRFVLSSVLAACANVGALDQGKWIHTYMRKKSIPLDEVLGTALLDMYAKCGRLDLAWEVFETMEYKELSSWNAMIGGLAMHGRAGDAIELFLKMRPEYLKPDGITFVGVLNACAHAGLVDKGVQCLDAMDEVFGIKPTVEHYGCVVDLLGRVGLFDEAEELISTMPMKPNSAVLGALLGACRVHGNVHLGEKVGKRLLAMEPQNSGRYALLSNIYAKAGKWEEVAKLRKMMKERGVKTTSGKSMIDLDGTIHEFKVGEGSHPQTKEIYEMLEKMIEKLELEGYVPDTSQVLLDIDNEEEKRTALSHHSEKLAIAFGLINTSPGTTIRIVKNLRTCEDCHSAGKLISRVYNREIIVRDRVRFHHFKNGKCSCMDFW